MQANVKCLHLCPQILTSALRFPLLADRLWKIYTAEQIADALRQAGFTGIRAFRNAKKPWIAMTARKK